MDISEMSEEPPTQKNMIFDRNEPMKFIHSGEVVWVLKDFELQIVRTYFDDCQLEEREPDPDDFVDWLITKNIVEEIGDREYDPSDLMTMDINVK